MVDRYSSVGIVTLYGLEVPGIETRLRLDFPYPCRRLESHPASYKMGTGSFTGVKQEGGDAEQ